MLASLYSADKQSLLSKSAPPKKILAVDDNFASLINLQQQLTALGYEVSTARNGLQACNILELSPAAADIIILDRRMPVLDGIATVERLKKNPHLKHIPVIMLTAADTPQDMQDGLRAGVFYYLPKPLKLETLSAVLVGAFQELLKKRQLTRRSHKQVDCPELLQSARYLVRTPEQADIVTIHLANIFPDPARVMNGIAELLSNAIEHGNLEIGFDSKSILLASGKLSDEISERLSIQPYCDRQVEVVIARKDDGVYLSITDEGEGFDWRNYVTIDFSRASHSHGRGIARARALSFDKLSYNTSGNKVVAFSKFDSRIDW